MPTTVPSTSTTRTGARPTAVARAGYVAAIAVDVVLLWVTHQLLAWGWPGFLTEDFTQVIGLVSASLVVSMVVNAGFLVRNTGPFRALGDLVNASVALAVTVRMWQVFPFDFTGYANVWNGLVRGALILGMVATGIAVVANIGKLAAAAGSTAPARSAGDDLPDVARVAGAGDPQPVGATIGIARAADDFLTNRRIAVTGVSREPANHGGNVVYQRLRERGYDVFAVNPNAERVEGDTSYPDLAAIPGGVDAVVIATRPAHALDTMRACVDLGIRQVWMHRAFGQGSVSDDAATWGREHGLRVIDGGCPLMFAPCDDPGHRMMRRVAGWTGNVPREVDA